MAITKSQKMTIDLSKDVTLQISVQHAGGQAPVTRTVASGTKGRILELLNSCDAEGNIDYHTITPYKAEVESKQYVGWMKAAYDEFIGPGIAHVTVTSIELEDFGVGSELEKITFKEWVKMGKPTKMHVDAQVTYAPKAFAYR
jgi:hypothetical protein